MPDIMMLAKNYVYRLVPKSEDKADLYALANMALSYGINEFNIELVPEGEEIGIMMELPAGKRSEKYLKDVVKEKYSIFIQSSRVNEE